MPAKRRLSLRWVSIALATALVLVAGAWALGGREDFGTIGKGGVNLRLLPKIGEEVPDFTAYDLEGNPVTLSSFRGQVVWLNFWGSWCPPCRAEMPDIVAAHQQLKGRNVVLLAVSLDETAEDAGQFAARNNAEFTILSDPNREATGRVYPIFNFPTHLFIDENGIVRAIVLSEMSKGEAVGRVEDILNAAP